ncbi:MAG: hypothetical protein ACLUE9_02570 [Hominenteromicrobium sp.]|uniref:hypothetical protein n=1 Tax=Hominenteromicrobium sp. TaxID=3073581 RepID=UPI003993E805
MPIQMLFVSLSISALLLILSMAFKVAGKLRLTLPLLYFLAAVVSTFFTDWTSKHEQLVLYGLYALIALVIISWVISLVKVIRRKQSEKTLEEDVAWQINRARELGIPIGEVLIDSDGTVLDAKTRQPLIK